MQGDGGALVAQPSLQALEDCPRDAFLRIKLAGSARIKRLMKPVHVFDLLQNCREAYDIEQGVPIELKTVDGDGDARSEPRLGTFSFNIKISKSSSAIQ